MKKKKSLELKYINVLTLTDTDFPYSLYPVDALDSLLELQRKD